MEELFQLVLELCQNAANTLVYKFMCKALQYDCNTTPIVKITEFVRNKPENATKYYTFMTLLNPIIRAQSVNNVTDPGCKFMCEALQYDCNVNIVKIIEFVSNKPENAISTTHT